MVRAAVTQSRAGGIDTLKVGPAPGNLPTVVKAIETAQHSQAMVDGGGGGLGLMIQLAANIVDQERFGEVLERMPCVRQPASQVQ